MINSVPKMEGAIAKRELKFFWIVDVSGSMSGKRLATLNTAVKEAIPLIKDALKSHSEVKMLMSSIKFSWEASWHIGPKSVEIEDIVWSEVNTDMGITSTSKAINMLCDELHIEKMRKRGLPPVCILISDGFCTDSEGEYDSSIERLNSMPWGKKAVRLVIAIGNEDEYDEEELLKFTNHKDIGVLKATNPEKLIEYIKWASVTASISSSASKINKGQESDSQKNVYLGKTPDFDDLEDDVF